MYKTPFTWNGKTYDSLAEAARQLNKHYNVIYHRHQKGYTCDDDLVSGTPVTWNGVAYLNCSRAAQALGYTPSTLYRWLQRGYTCDEDVPHNERFRGQGRAVTCEWNGVTYHSMSEAASALGISREAMRLRVNKGYTCDAELQSQGLSGKTCVWNGVQYATVKAAWLASVLDVGYAAFARYVREGYQNAADVSPVGRPSKSE